MPLSSGERLGPYEILTPIGAGGMGEVYRARDTRLNRDVAIKVSAERFSERFDREARVIASLNHPNICTLFDVGSNYLVMELVEGPTLADRIKEGALPLNEALPIAKQIADALDAAHEKGVTHRDLKPANVKVKPDGTVKVLDFGLAKAGGTPAAASDNSPTLTMGETEAGVILGTASYMAPEQAKGKPVDKRADIYAFGVVLYEMVTGKRLHRGETTTEILASVLKEEPKWDKVPAPVHRLLQRCLEKDPQNRLRHIGDVMSLVDDPAHAPKVAAPGGKQWLWPTVAALVVAMAAVGWNWYRASRLTDLPLVRHDVDLGAEIVLPPPRPFITNFVISPDGTRIAYVAGASAGGPPKLFTRKLDQPNAVELSGTEGARGPFFSPDGRWIGFASQRKLNKISVDGGALVPLMDLSAGFAGASWGEESIVVTQQASSLLMRIPSGGGQPTPVPELPKGEDYKASPQFLPRGKAVLLATAAPPVGGVLNADKAAIAVLSLADHHTKTLVQGGAFGRYVASVGGTGHLLYTNRGALYAIPFDPDKLETRGTAVPILSDVMGTAGASGKFDVSQTGTLIYQKGAAGGGPVLMTVQWLDSTSKPEPLLAKPGIYTAPHLSPDGKRLALSVADGLNRDIEVYEWQSERTTKLTFGGKVYTSPTWTPDGHYVVFNSVGTMFWARADGAGQPQQLAETKAAATQIVPWSFSPDGKHLAFMEQSTGGSQIWTLPIDQQNGEVKAGMPEQFLKSQFNDVQPAFSPDGKWLAYRSNATGQNEIYVRPFPPPASGQGGQWVISTERGTDPHWSRAGHDLLYVGPDGMMAASYTVKGETFQADKPRVWRANVPVTDFDLSPDGKRLATVVPVQGAEAPKPEHEVVFLENFFDELRRRVPAGK
jgi:serine/threonine protein kinase/Tol biopolymer transport system component